MDLVTGKEKSAGRVVWKVLLDSVPNKYQEKCMDVHDIQLIGGRRHIYSSSGEISNECPRTVVFICLKPSTWSQKR